MHFHARSCALPHRARSLCLGNHLPTEASLYLPSASLPVRLDPASASRRRIPGPMRILQPAGTSFHPPDSPEGLACAFPVIPPVTVSALLRQIPLPKKLDPAGLSEDAPNPIPYFPGEPKKPGFGGTAHLQRGFEGFTQPSANEQSAFHSCPSYRSWSGSPARSARRPPLTQRPSSQPSGFPIPHPTGRPSCEFRPCGERLSHRMENMPP